MSGQPGIIKTPWSAEEVAILEREYPTGASRAVMKLLPHRNRGMIRAKAESMQLRVMSRKNYEKQQATEWIDAAIRREYRNGHPCLQTLARQLNRTHGWIKWRAGVLGVRGRAPGTPTGPWLPAEIALLEDCMERGLSITMMHKKFHKAGFVRSLTAIRHYVEKRGLGWNHEFWTACDVARAFNLDPSRPLEWIHQGKLKAQRMRGPSRDDLPVTDEKRVAFAVRPRDVREFMLKYPEHWDHRKMNKEVLVDLLSGGDYGLSSGAFGAGYVSAD